MIHKSYSTVVPGTKNYQYYCYNRASPLLAVVQQSYHTAILQQIIKTTVLLCSRLFDIASCIEN